MTNALIGAVLAGAVGVWALVVVKLVQQRSARVRRRAHRDRLDARLNRLDTRHSTEAPESGPARG